MNMAVEFEENTKSLSDYVKIVKRRYKQLIYPAVAVFALVLIAAIFWPPTFKAEATILIEEQEIPKDLVRSTVTSFADQQIQVITQRVMTLSNVMELVEKYDLYNEDDLKRMTTTEIFNEVRDENVGLNVISADVTDPVTGRPTVATIAFTLSFQHASPKKAQRVTSELVTLYLNENLRIRTEKSVNASAFLTTESKSLGEQLESLEAQLAEFKSKNEESLPEFTAYNKSIIDRTERELLENSLRLKELEKRKIQYEADLILATPYAPTVLSSGEQVLSDYDRLKSLDSEFRRKSALYNESHPDLVRLSRELEEVRAQVGGSISTDDLLKNLKGEEDKLAAMRDKFEAGHPELVAQEKVVQSIGAAIDTASSSTSTEVAPDNPSYIFLDSQLKGTITEINIIQEKTAQLEEKIRRFEDFILRGPAVEKEYSSLQRDYQNTQQKYLEIKNRLMEAELSQNLEEGRQGERFTLIQPPIMPEKPISPNRTILLLIGFFLSAAVGIAIVVVAEMLDPSIRGERQLADVIGAQPLISVPYIMLENEVSANNKKLYQVIGGLVVVGILALLAIHFFVKPLDVMWFVLMRKLGI